MFSIDDHAGNVVTTVTTFMVAATILYVARGAFLILFLSLLFAYLLEPALTWIQHHSRLGQNNRTWAIAQVYLVGTLVLGGLGYEFGPHLAAQIKNLNAAVPGILDGLSSGRTTASLGSTHGLSTAQQQWIKDELARNHDSIAHVFGRGAASAAYLAERAIWLFVIPIFAIFILRDGRQIVDSIVESVGLRADRIKARRIFGQVETMLAKFIRAQLALAALSFVFYSVSMLVLGFPYAIALGVLGGSLEFLPAVGWIASAAGILTIGFLTHSHWIWMAGLIVVWRLVQDYINSPRIIGDRLEMQPLTVVFALMVGGQLGGIAGLYLSVPAVAVLRIVWLESLSTRNSATSISTNAAKRGDTLAVTT
ncbi:MAG: AI-2E family transporter [Candidatus Korobacteraceae bacterium]